MTPRPAIPTDGPALEVTFHHTHRLAADAAMDPSAVVSGTTMYAARISFAPWKLKPPLPLPPFLAAVPKSTPPTIKQHP